MHWTYQSILTRRTDRKRIALDCKLEARRKIIIQGRMLARISERCQNYYQCSGIFKLLKISPNEQNHTFSESKVTRKLRKCRFGPLFWGSKSSLQKQRFMCLNTKIKQNQKLRGGGGGRTKIPTQKTKCRVSRGEMSLQLLSFRLRPWRNWSIPWIPRKKFEYGEASNLLVQFVIFFRLSDFSTKSRS